LTYIAIFALFGFSTNFGHNFPPWNRKKIEKKTAIFLEESF
jgi:hypothetical protein